GTRRPLPAERTVVPGPARGVSASSVVALAAEGLHRGRAGRVHCGTGRLVGPQVAALAAPWGARQPGRLAEPILIDPSRVCRAPPRPPRPHRSPTATRPGSRARTAPVAPAPPRRPGRRSPRPVGTPPARARFADAALARTGAASRRPCRGRRAPGSGR